MVYGEWCILFGAFLIVTDTTGMMHVVKYKMLKVTFWLILHVVNRLSLKGERGRVWCIGNWE